MSTQIRIRDNGNVRKLKFPQETLEEMQKVVAANNMMEKTKRTTIRKLAGVSSCCVCDGVPAYSVTYPFHEGGATSIEIYCSKCIKTIYSRG